MSINYYEYINSEAWREFRQGYLAKKKRKGCEFCGADKPLDLHHRTYRRLGRERYSDVLAICRKCHDEIHDLERNGGAKSLQSATDKIRSRHQKQRPPKPKKDKTKQRVSAANRRDKAMKAREGFELSQLKYVDREEIEQGRTSRGGYGKKQLAKRGVPWPPPKGWLRALANNK